MLSFFSKHKILFLFIAFFVFIIFVAIVFKGGGNSLPTPIPTSESSLWNFSPGSTTKSEVVNELGQPLNEVKQGNQTTDEFKSLSPARNNQVVFQNNTSQFFKQIISANENIKIPDITNKYGSTNNVLYGPNSGSSGYNLYVYPDKGIAYIGNQDTQDVLEIWYFQPTSLDNFIKLWASSYSKTPNVGQ